LYISTNSLIQSNHINSNLSYILLIEPRQTLFFDIINNYIALNKNLYEQLN